MSSSDFTNQVRQTLPLSTLIGERVKLRRKGKDHTGLCPFHSEKSPSFTVNDEKGFYYCFGCGAKGDHFDFVMKTQGTTFPETMAMLSEKSHIPLPERHHIPVNTTAPAVYDWLTHVGQWYQTQLTQPESTPVREYVLKRGLKPETLKTFQIGYAPAQSALLWKALQKEGATQEDLLKWGLLGEDETSKRVYDRFRNRVMVPICDARGRIVAFGGRLLEGQGPKYLNSPETPLFHKGDMLFAHHLAAGEARKHHELFIVEGYFDVMALYDRGLKHVVAPLGTGFTAHQLQLSWSICSEPTICFDGDEAGLRAAGRVLDFVFPLLKPGYSVNFMFLPSGEDPDSFLRTQGVEAFLKLQEGKISLMDYLWQTQSQIKPLTTPERLADFKGRLREIISSIVDPHVKNAYGQEIRQRLEGLRQVQGHATKQWRAVPQMGLRLSKTLPVLQQKILICLAVNHPQVVSDDVEVFAALPFSDEVLIDIKRHIVQYFCQEAPLDKAHVLAHMNTVGMGAKIADILGNKGLSIHAKFCLPDIPLSQVKEGWRELVFQIIKRTEIRQDIQSAKLLLQESMTQEKWQKLKALILESRVADTGHELDVM